MTDLLSPVGATVEPVKPGKSPRSIRRDRSSVRDSGGNPLAELVLELGARVERLEALLRAKPGADPSLFAVEADRLLARVGKVMGLTVAQIRSRVRTNQIAEARWMAAALLRATGRKYVEIAPALGWTEPSAAHYALLRHEEMLGQLPRYRMAWELVNKEAQL